ncbi:lactonase family protein [Pontiella sp.]|uniref:lactonase family protein n=1 Tax=Pontiella sp. TaxID=2837462 RepID=UPI00356A1E67
MKTILMLSLVAFALCADAGRVYFGTGNGNGIYFADFDEETGELTQPQLAIELGRPGFLAIHPNKQYLYSTAFGGTLGRQGGVAAMKIAPEGRLELLNMQATEGKGNCHVSLDQTGQLLTTAYYGSGSVASFGILADGSVSEAKSYFAHSGSGTHPKRQNKAYAHSVVMNPANTHAYAADLGIDKIMIYRIEPKAGTLTPAGEAIVPGGGMGPRHMKWNREGSILYVLNELDLSVSVFKAVAQGKLEFVETVPTLPEGADKTQMTCAEIRIHPNGKFIYASNRDLSQQRRDSITLFSRFEDGFKRIESTPAQVWVPRNFNLAPSGKWMLVAGQRSNDIAIFQVNPETGKLTFSGTTVPLAGAPICIEFL